MTRIHSLLLSVAALAPAAAAQQTLTVPTQVGNIQAAIDQAQPGDTVLVLAGVYAERIDFLGKAIEVRGEGAGATVLDVSAAAEFNDFPFRPAVRMSQGEGPLSVLRDLTVTGAEGQGNDCGSNQSTGVYAEGSTPTLIDCVIEGNQGCFGGGFSGGGLLVGCVLRGNSSALEGGGVRGDADLVNCLVEGNSTVNGEGGGVFATGPCTLTGCEIVDNWTGFDGYSGGGVAGPADLDRCLVARNTANTFGGMIGAVGGGLHDVGKVERCTVVSNVNEPCLFGDCGFAISGATEIVDSIIGGNVPANLTPGLSVSWSTVVEPGGYPGVGILSGDPLFSDIVAGDYSLQSGSPAIDAGDPSAPLDLDGTRRDQGAFPKLGALTTPSATFGVSAAAGGAQDFAVDFGPSGAGDLMWILGSLSGFSPGVNVGGVSVPLNVDSYTTSLLLAPAAPPILNGFQVLDTDGRAEATLDIPAAAAVPAIGVTAVHSALRI
ncbi:MAG: choice-of-anchor Q domain-containing protein, partial [Planctomycetota bacterium]